MLPDQYSFMLKMQNRFVWVQHHAHRQTQLYESWMFEREIYVIVAIFPKDIPCHPCDDHMCFSTFQMSLSNWIVFVFALRKMHLIDPVVLCDFFLQGETQWEHIISLIILCLPISIFISSSPLIAAFLINYVFLDMFVMGPRATSIQPKGLIRDKVLCDYLMILIHLQCLSQLLYVSTPGGHLAQCKLLQTVHTKVFMPAEGTTAGTR